MKFPRISLVILLAVFAILPVQHGLLEKQVDASINKAITDATQAANSTVTKLFINEVYPRLAAYLDLEQAQPLDSKGLTGDALAETDRTIRSFMLGSDIMKIKIYARNSMTIYSTDLSQIGEDRSQNPALNSALQGIPGSQITHRGKFSSGDGGVFEKDWVASYIPIRNKTGIVMGVVEIYTDRTSVVANVVGSNDQLHAAMLITQVLIFVLIVLLVWSLWSPLAIISKEQDAGEH
jgi:hypothetical protein